MMIFHFLADKDLVLRNLLFSPPASARLSAIRLLTDSRLERCCFELHYFACFPHLYYLFDPAMASTQQIPSLFRHLSGIHSAQGQHWVLE